MSPRLIGSMLGVLIGMGLVIYLDRTGVIPPKQSANPVATVSLPTTTGTIDDTAALRVENARQARELARLRLAREADRTLDLLRSTVPPDPSRPELARYRDLSPELMDNEIKTADAAVFEYTSGGLYARLSHQDLYRRVNELFDLRGLTAAQNAMLAQAVMYLNELTVQHAEEALRLRKDDEVIRAAADIGGWAFRLNDDQERRLIRAVETVASRYR